VTDRIRLLIADDHAIFRSGVRAVLEGEDGIDVVGEASTGVEAVALAGRLRPDVVLMDLRMPEKDGVTATADIRSEHPDVQVLVLTTYDTDADIVRAVEAGATGYLLKDAVRDDLVSAVRAASRGESVLSPAVAARLMGQVRAPADDRLSGREIDVLELVARGHANKQIAARLQISEATVKTHLVHIFGKLGTDDRTSAVTSALERGIIRLTD
jgi:DNA-binding NarL/FixJ family response regulator